MKLIPINGETARAGSRKTNAAFSFAVYPLHSPFIILNQGHKLLTTPLVVGFNPLNLFFREHCFVHHLCLDWDGGESFKTKPYAALEFMLRLVETEKRA